MRARSLQHRSTARLARIRWRRSGAWLWPAFITLTLVDAVVGHLLPPVGETQSLVAAALLGLVFNVLGVLLLSRPGAAVIRRRRPDLPNIVARDYAGTAVVASITAVPLAIGLIQRPAIVAGQHYLDDALRRAEPRIDAHAPALFRRDLTHVKAF